MQSEPSHRTYFPLTSRTARLVSGVILFVYIATHLLNHTLGLVSLAAAERGLELAKAVWHSVPGTLVLYGAAATHLTLALRTIYLREHWHLPVIEYIRLGAGFSLPLLLIGHVVITRMAYSLHDVTPHYASVVASLTRSGNEGWQLALLAPGWLHGCLGLWINLVRLRPPPVVTFAFFAVVALVPCFAAAGFLAMSAEVSGVVPEPAVVQDTAIAARRASLDWWRHALLGGYLALVGGALLLGPVWRRLFGRASQRPGSLPSG
jgi:adenylate cyclase